MRFEVSTVVETGVVIFQDMTLCSLVGGYQRFRGNYHLHLQAQDYNLNKLLRVQPSVQSKIMSQRKIMIVTTY
jgi:hypothetical protein